jgi:carbohydrate kinase (thermoresistant glucokinase family)
MDQRNAAGESAVMTCSALRRSYRDALLGGRPEVRLVYLLVDRDTLSRHLAGRHGHFFPQKLLDSQLADQEVPHDEQNVLVVIPQRTPQDTVAEISARLWPDAPAWPPDGTG